MISKHPILPALIRQIPKRFSWVDHRLVTQRYIDNLSHQAAKLYLFLITVGDHLGLSYYSDESIKKRLSMDQTELHSARDNLIRTGLIAYKPPLYQVLSIGNGKSNAVNKTSHNKTNKYHIKNENHQGVKKQSTPTKLDEILNETMKGILYDHL